jgi:hypothetical protein
MTRYLLTNAENHTWRGSHVCPGQSILASNTEENVLTRNAEELGDSPLVAIMLNPWHAQIDHQKMLELEIGRNDLDEIGSSTNVVVRETTVPSVTTDQKIVFALMTIQEVYGNPVFKCWADDWISGSDRSAEAAGKMFAQLGKIAKETSSASAEPKTPGTGQENPDRVDTKYKDFSSRASEAIFAAQIYMDRTENWPLLASRSVNRAVGGLQLRVDLAAIAERAIASSAKGAMRSRSAA